MLLGEREAVVGWKVVGARRGAAAVQLPVEKGERDVVRRPDNRSGLEQLARRVGHSAAMDEVVDQLPGRPQRAEHEHRHEDDREHAQPARAAVDRARVACDHGHEQHPFDEREQPLRPQPLGARQQNREDHRREHGAGHGPARLADDAVVCVRAGGRRGIRPPIRTGRHPGTHPTKSPEGSSRRDLRMEAAAALTVARATAREGRYPDRSGRSERPDMGSVSRSPPGRGCWPGRP